MVILIENLEGNEEKQSIYSLTLCSELNLLISASGKLMKIWKLNKKGKWDGKPPQVLEGHEFRINCMSCLYLGDEGALLASGSAFEGSCLKLWFINNMGFWDGKKPESLKIKTWSIKSIAMEFLEDGGVLLAAGGGEYGNNLSVYRLTPEYRWNKKEPLVLKEFTYWAYPVALCSFNEDKIILAVSGGWMETFLKLWTFDTQGNWDGNPPLKLSLPPCPDYESNYPRSFEMSNINNKGAVLIAGIGSDENEYWTGDAGYVIVWNFDGAGSVAEEKAVILKRYDAPVEQVVLHRLSECEILVACRISYNEISVTCLKKTNGVWKEQNTLLFEHHHIGCFISTPSEILLIGISENKLISWSVLASK
ncbi:MAG: hypothetical protein ACTSSH_05500 [Candidatus Heimdallarchaeota archaeon]